MPPEIITTKRDTEIGRLLERVIRDHRKDISAFSKGHLNENNLYKPPEAGRQSWQTAKLPAIKLKHAVSVGKECRDRKMWEAVACFSAGSAFATDLPSKSSKVAAGLDINSDDVNLEEFDASYFLLPTSDGFKIMPSLQRCIRKRDEVAQLKMFDDVIVEKHNLTDRGWYSGSRATKDINFKQSTSTDIQVYRKLWEEVLTKCNMYNPLLTDIKEFYNGYLTFLKQNNRTTTNTAGKRLEEVREKNKMISQLAEEVEELEAAAMRLIRTNENLKEEHDLTETVLSEVKLQSEALESTCSGTELDLQSMMEQPTIAANIEQLRLEILHKGAEIKSLHKRQRQVMVPMEVYQCMVQCVQSAEIELQKQTKNIEALERKKKKYRTQVIKELDKLTLTPEQKQQLLELTEQTN